MKHQSDKISFRLDGRVYGTGTVVSVAVGKSLDIQYHVRLTRPCKKFNIGDTIVVDDGELCDPQFYSVLQMRNVRSEKSYIVVCETREDEENLLRITNNSNIAVTNISTPENSDLGIFLNQFPL